MGPGGPSMAEVVENKERSIILVLVIHELISVNTNVLERIIVAGVLDGRYKDPLFARLTVSVDSSNDLNKVGSLSGYWTMQMKLYG